MYADVQDLGATRDSSAREPTPVRRAECNFFAPAKDDRWLVRDDMAFVASNMPLATLGFLERISGGQGIGSSCV